MLIVRKIDFYLQVTLGALMVLSIPWLFLYGFMAGLLVLGCWQLISATANTRLFLAHSQKKLILKYWRFTVTILCILGLCIPLSIAFDPDDVQVLAALALAGSVPIAIYYLVIYDKLITSIGLSKELSGLTKSKH